jgi:hypothetical protein
MICSRTSPHDAAEKNRSGPDGGCGAYGASLAFRVLQHRGRAGRASKVAARAVTPEFAVDIR